MGEQGSLQTASHHQVPRGALMLPALEGLSLYLRQLHIKQAKQHACPQVLHKWDCAVKHLLKSPYSDTERAKTPFLG